MKGAGKIKQHHSFNLIVFLSGLLFVISLGLSAAAFVYSRIIEAQVNEKGIALAEEKSKLELSDLNEYKLLGERLKEAQVLVNQHKALTLLFRELNESTLHNIRYTKFTLKDDPDGAFPRLALEGKAASFNALTVQTDVFRRSDTISDVAFDKISLDEDGVVTFEILLSLVPDKLLFQ